MPMDADWKWFYEYQKTAHEQKDAQRIQLMNYFDEGMKYRYDDPERALQVFSEGVDLARKLADPCMELFFNYWCCEVYVFNLLADDKGLARAIQNFTLAHRPEYQNCFFIGRVYRILIDSYYHIDAVGHADKIRAMIAYTVDNVRLDHDTVLLLQRYRAGLHYTFEEWDDAEREALRYLEASRGIDHRLIGAYILLIGIAIHKKEYSKIQPFAIELEAVAIREKRKASVAYALLIQAVYKLRFEQNTDAESFYRRALLQVEDYKAILTISFYDVACAFEELSGNPENALRLRDKQLMETVGATRYQTEVYCRIQRCRLYGRMGKPLEQELADAYTATQKLKSPQIDLKYLQKIENGDYSDPYLLQG